MKNTYTGTLLNPDLTKAKVIVRIYNDLKWNSEAGDGIEVVYNGITSWDIISGGEEAEEIEKNTDAEGCDEYHEYLVLHFENGETSTFRNSHVAMFII